MARYNRMIRRESERPPLLTAGLKGLAGLTLGAAVSWIIYSKLAVDHNAVLPDALPAERKTFQSPVAGTLSYYFNRETGKRPLVLIHSINAAASAYEMRPLFLHYYNQRPVYALDLPGFGFSSREKRAYSPLIYITAILDFIETQVGEPADVVALSLSSEFAARAALARPDWFNSLVLISPTGFSLKNARRAQQGGRGGTSDAAHALLSVPLWARPFYDLLTTRTSIKAFLQRNFTGAVPDDLIDYDYASAHQPDAEHAPLYFVTGKLFTPAIRELVYERLEVPTLVIYDRDPYVSFEMLPNTLTRNTYWQAVRLVPMLGLPHFERLSDTAEVLDNFWKE